MTACCTRVERALSSDAAMASLNAAALTPRKGDSTGGCSHGCCPDRHRQGVDTTRRHPEHRLEGQTVVESGLQLGNSFRYRRVHYVGQTTYSGLRLVAGQVGGRRPRAVQDLPVEVHGPLHPTTVGGRSTGSLVVVRRGGVVRLDLRRLDHVAPPRRVGQSVFSRMLRTAPAGSIALDHTVQVPPCGPNGRDVAHSPLRATARPGEPSSLLGRTGGLRSGTALPRPMMCVVRLDVISPRRKTRPRDGHTLRALTTTRRQADVLYSSPVRHEAGATTDRRQPTSPLVPGRTR